MQPRAFQLSVLQWFDEHGRKNLPWQFNITPYRIWVSEIMLQQTQVTTVIPYYLKFIEHYPDVETLAAANIDSVLRHWSGLGYYARARNLYKSARIITEQQRFPDTLEELMQLPGVGQSTAGAILSIAFNNSHPILDGNVRRVLARYHAITGWPLESKVNKLLWRLSKIYTPIARAADYTQAMMDLGATICTRSNPRCEYCPVNMNCEARRQGRVYELPTAKPVKKLPVKQCTFLFLTNLDKQIMLERRPAVGIWGGLWSLPEFESVNAALNWCQEKNIRVIEREILASKRHTFSHFHLNYTTIIVQTENPSNNVMAANGSVWYKPEQITMLGLPAPIKRLLEWFI